MQLTTIASIASLTTLLFTAPVLSVPTPGPEAPSVPDAAPQEARLKARSPSLAEWSDIIKRQIPPPDPEACAKAEEQCDCTGIDKSTSDGMSEYYQCTTQFICELCKGLWDLEKGEGQKSVDPEEK